MTLRQTQSEFAQHVALLIQKARDLGYEVTLAEAYRPPETALLYAQQGRGIQNSLHTKRLAIDLNLFKNGKYLTSTKAHRELGDWWEKQHSRARWGGRFGDGNHYSFEWHGVR